MALITLPDTNPPAISREFQLVRADTTLELFSGAEVIVQASKAIWALSFNLRPMKIAAARPWQSVLVQLSKLANTFKITPPGWSNGMGYVGANPTVDGAGQLGLTMDLTGFSAEVATRALVGDFIEIPTTSGSEFKQLTADLITDTFGDVTAAFEPAMREAGTNSGTVDIKTPQITMRLMNPVADLPADVDGFYHMSFGAVETFGP